MTHDIPKPPTDVDVEVDNLLARIVSHYGMDDLLEARGTLRRALMYAWYDGQSAGMSAYRADVDHRPNPWTRSVKD